MKSAWISYATDSDRTYTGNLWTRLNGDNFLQHVVEVLPSTVDFNSPATFKRFFITDRRRAVHTPVSKLLRAITTLFAPVGSSTSDFTPRLQEWSEWPGKQTSLLHFYEIFSICESIMVG